MINSGAVNHPLRPMSLPVSSIPMQGPNPSNQNLHIKQTMDRLRCIQKHLKNPASFGRTIRELIDWCSDPRAFRSHFQECLMECLQAVSEVAGVQGYDLSLCYRLLQMCYEQRDKFIPNASTMLSRWFRRVQSIMISKQPPSHADHMSGAQITPGSYGVTMMNPKPNMAQYQHMGQRVSDQSLWNQQLNTPQHNQPPSLSVITTATVWDVSTTQTPPALGHSQSSSTSFNSQHLTHPGPQPGGGSNMYPSYPGDYPNKQLLNDGYVQQCPGGVPPGRMGAQRHHLNHDQSHRSSAAAAAAAAVAAAAAAATATATATATFIKEQQDQNQMNAYEQMAPGMGGSMHQQTMTSHHQPSGVPHQGMQPSGRMRQQMPPEYGRAASVPTSFSISSPRPLSHTPIPSYGNESFKTSCRPPMNSYGSPPFNNDPNPLRTPDIFSHCHDPTPGLYSRPPGSNVVQSNSYYPPPQQESYPAPQNHRHHPPPQHHAPTQHHAPQHNESRFCSSQPPIPGNPTPPLTPGSAHNVPPYPSLGMQSEQKSDDLRLTFPVRDGVVLRPFRLEHNLSVSNHAFHLRDHVHKTLVERPDLDLQFKCFHHEDPMKHTNWPHMVQIQVNSTPLPVPRGSDKTMHKPFYLKSVCQPGRNVIEITVSSCCCSHFFVLQLVHRPSIPFVLKGLLVKRLLPNLNCRAKIKRNFTNGDVSTNDVIMNTSAGGNVLEQVGGMVKVSLLCPITRSRIGIPARGQDCKHIQCFDLKSYLQTNSENASWSCPVCSKLALLELLEVDEFMQGVLKAVTLDYHHVSIDANCNWAPLSSPSSFPPNQLSRTMSGPLERGVPFANRFAKQELYNCGVKREPGTRRPGFGPNQEQYISALSIKKEPRPSDIHVKPDPDGPPHKRLRSVPSPGVSLNHLPAPSPASAGGCSKIEHSSGFPQSKNVQKFGGPHQMQKSPGPGGPIRSGELLVADMKEYVAANDMVSIEKRLNPAVNPTNVGLPPGNSPKRKSNCHETIKSLHGPETPMRPPSNSAVLNPPSVPSLNCPTPSAPNHSSLTTCHNDFPSDIGDINVGTANPETPVVSELNLDSLDSVFEPFFETNDKDGEGSAPLGLDSLASMTKSEAGTNVSQVDSSGDIMDILSDLGATSSNPTNPEEENILSLFDDTS